MSCGADQALAQRRALLRKQALAEEAEMLARRRKEKVAAVDEELEAQRAAFERHRQAQLIALQALQARALSMLGDGQKHAVVEEHQERSKAKEGVAVWKDVAEATIQRQRLAMVAREREAMKSQRAVAAYQAAFRRQVTSAAAQEGRMIAREKADAEKDRQRSASKESSGPSRRQRRARAASGEEEDDASTYYSDDDAENNGKGNAAGAGEEEEELAYPGASIRRRRTSVSSVGSSSDPYRRQLARARAELATKAPRASPFFGPRAVDQVMRRKNEDVCVTSCLARVGDAGPTMVQSAVRAPTVVVRQRKSSIRRKRSASREGSVTTGGEGSSVAGAGGGSPFLDARDQAILAAAALEEARRKEGILQQERARKAAERGRAAGASLREEREAQAALETLARLDAWANATGRAAGSAAIDSASSSGSYAYLPSQKAMASPSTALRSLRASLPVTQPPPPAVRPAFMKEAGAVNPVGSGMRFAAEQPTREGRVFRDDVISGANSMDRRADGRNLNTANVNAKTTATTATTQPGTYVSGLKKLWLGHYSSPEVTASTASTTNSVSQAATVNMDGPDPEALQRPARQPSFLQRQLLQLKYTQTQEYLSQRRRENRDARLLAAPSVHEVAKPHSFAGTLSLSDALLRRKQLLDEEHDGTAAALNWRLRLGHVIEGHIVQLIVLLLIVLDVIAVCCEIMLQSVCGSQLVDEATGLPTSLPQGTVLEPLHRVETWETALHWISLSILIVFLLQQMLLMVAYGFAYFKRLFNVIDLVIIVTAIVLEVVLHGEDAPGLIAILLSWRIVRVIHGFFSSAETDIHQREVLLEKLEHEKQWHTLDRGYWMTTLRMMSFKFSARVIQRWWLMKKGKPFGKAREQQQLVLPQASGAALSPVAAKASKQKEATVVGLALPPTPVVLVPASPSADRDEEGPTGQEEVRVLISPERKE